MKYQIGDKIIFNNEELVVVKLGEIYSKNEYDKFLLTINSKKEELIVYIKDLEKQNEKYFTEINDILHKTETTSSKTKKKPKKLEQKFYPQPNAYLNSDDYDGYVPVSLYQKAKVTKYNKNRRIKQTLEVRNSDKILSIPLKSTKEPLVYSDLPRIGKIADVDYTNISKFDKNNSVSFSQSDKTEMIVKENRNQANSQEKNNQKFSANCKCGMSEIVYTSQWDENSLCKYHSEKNSEEHSEEFKPKNGISIIKLKKSRTTIVMQESEHNYYDHKKIH